MPTSRRTILAILVMLSFCALLFSHAVTQVNALNIRSSTNVQLFTIIVSRYGFNGTAGSLSITVPQGSHVKITFVYGDNDLSVDNPHAIMFDGYRIQTVNIGRSNPSVTVDLVADVAGTFNFYCYIPCIGMENLLGHLVVTPTQNALAPTTLGLTASTGEGQNASFHVEATVLDENGKPLAAVPVTFYENTTFGKLFLGTETTNSEGVAVLRYEPTRTGRVQIIAENPGNAQYAGSSKSALITIPSTTSPSEGEIYLGVDHTWQPPNPFYGIANPSNLAMIGVPRSTNIILVVLAGIVILGVWSTYGYVARQIANISRQSATDQRITEPYLLPGAVPVPTDTEVRVAMTPGWKNPVGLILLTVALGMSDVILLNALRLPVMWTALSLVGVSAIEAGAIAQIFSGRWPRD